MQDHFSKLLTEQERAGSKNKSAKWGQRLKYDPDSDYEDQPRRVSMSRHAAHNYDSKSLTDVLGPLRGYLRRNCGRRWDDVYSELCRNLDRRSVSGLHVFQHMRDYVDTNCWIGAKTGKVYCWGKYGNSQPNDFYVHPWTGILCEVPRVRRRFSWTRNEGVKTEVKLGDGKSYLQIDGIWYYTEWTLVKLWKEKGGQYRPHLLVSYEDKVFQKKRQLGKKELKKLKLRNIIVVKQ